MHAYMQQDSDSTETLSNRPEDNHERTTKTALCVRELQKHLPKARIVYVSATGATGELVVCMSP